MKTQLKMRDVQNLITAVNEAKLPPLAKHNLLVKLEDMQDELLTHNTLIVSGEG